MRIIIIGLLAALTLAAPTYAQYKQPSYGGGSYGTGSNPSSHGVGGYTNPNTGNYVQPHQQTNPNGTQYDNYGTRGNFNPSNGQTGTKPPKY